MTTNERERLAYSTAEAAELMSLSERAVREMCAKRILRARRYGTKWVIPRTAILAWLAGDDAQPLERPAESSRSAEVLPFRPVH